MRLDIDQQNFEELEHHFDDWALSLDRAVSSSSLTDPLLEGLFANHKYALSMAKGERSLKDNSQGG
ncbi:hypothetical protein [Rhodopseudomonas palustris]|uniref:Uncharacterized protein n=1 Tax=Rhodopseudomonas palustris TaxID=1076 RepID=A0A418VJT8_RHOPL|nr:hypothetical protein [Rhodopseudomonas palustris]RJF76311.1 hypothetical protein D4Q52_06765 [Rhodopseudomonas palustris]